MSLTAEDQKKMVDNLKEKFELKPKLLAEPGEFTNIVRHYEIRSKQARIDGFFQTLRYKNVFLSNEASRQFVFKNHALESRLVAF